MRPEALEDIVRNAMHQLPGSGKDHRNDALKTLASARQFQKTAQLGRDEGLLLPVISNLHEAARLAITAVAAKNGLRFSNKPGAHVVVVDYALGIRMVNRIQWAQIDELRDLRHKTNYPSDLVEPTETELDQFAQLTDDLLRKSQQMIAPVPPPPKK